jgi:hypothetical protein
MDVVFIASLPSPGLRRQRPFLCGRRQSEALTDTFVALQQYAPGVDTHDSHAVDLVAHVHQPAVDARHRVLPASHHHPQAGGVIALVRGGRRR